MPIIIKRYRNRKLYNTQSKRYITLEEIEELVRQQEEIKVIDNDSGNDITATTLSQIIFELEKNQTGVLPVDLLFSLVRSGGKRIDVIRRNIFSTLNITHQFDVEIERRIKLLVTNGELSQKDGDQLFQKLVSIGFKPENVFDSVEGKIQDFLRAQQIPTKDDLQSLLDKIDDLSKKVEYLHPDVAASESQESNDQSIE